MFGDSKATVADRFLRQYHGGVYELRPEYNTERKILAALPGDHNQHLRNQLFSLVCNVCLIWVGNNQFVPRIEMETTR